MAEEAKLAAAAFSVFADRLAAEVATDREKLEAERERLAPLKELLGSVEIHAGGQLVAADNVANAVMCEETWGRPEKSLLVSFATDNKILPLSKYAGGAGAKVMVANQTVGVLPGFMMPTVEVERGEISLLMLAGERGSRVRVKGLVRGLSDDDKAMLAGDDELMCRYLATGEGPENSNYVTFEPRIVHMDVTPGLEKVAELLGPLRKSVDLQPPQNFIDIEDIGIDRSIVSQPDCMRYRVAFALGVRDRIDTLNECMGLKQEGKNLSEIHRLMGEMELRCGDRAPCRLTVGQGHPAAGDGGSPVWNVSRRSGGRWSIPIRDLKSLRVTLSGQTVERDRDTPCVLYTAPGGSTCMKIPFHSGIGVTGRIDGPGAEDDSVRQMLRYIMSNPGVASPPFMFDVFYVCIDMSSVESLLDKLGVDVERQRSINLHLKLLLHAAKCRSPKCLSANCAEMKEILKHPAGCKIKANGGCKKCKRIWALLQIHAGQCKTDNCPVPNCLAIRERYRQAAHSLNSSVGHSNTR